MDDRFIAWVCMECGTKYGRAKPWIATWHYGKCDVCGVYDGVTEPRDFGGLDLSEKEVDDG
jgi:predicted ATP-dependent serine protease